MGGIITLTIRKKDGEVHKTSCWTNGLPYQINNIGIADEAHFDEYLAVFAENNASGDYYSSEPFTIPSEYGLIVVDYMTNELVYATHYCGFGYTGWASISLDADQTIFNQGPNGGFRDKEQGGHAYDIAQFLEKKQLLSASAWNPKLEKREEVYSGDYLNGLSLDEFIALFFDKDINRTWHFHFKLGDFKLTRYEHNVEGLKQLKEHVLRLGFVLTNEEEEVWNKRLQ